MRVFITGASSGIGAAMAKKFDAMGAQLGLVGRSQEKLDAVLSSMQNAQAHTTYALDVTDRAALFAAARDFDGKAPVDIVLANAGISIGVKTEYEEDLDVLEKVYRTNVFAMAATFHPFIEPMSKRGGGQFAGIGSVGGIRGLPGSEAYCSSKAAVISYLESLRNDVRKYGISVTTICPGFVRTPLVDKQIPEQAKEFGISEEEVIQKIMLKDTVDGEFTTLDDVANVALMLAAFETNALTGQSIVVSHGWFMQ